MTETVEPDLPMRGASLPLRLHTSKGYKTIAIVDIALCWADGYAYIAEIEDKGDGTDDFNIISYRTPFTRRMLTGPIWERLQEPVWEQHDWESTWEARK